mgnify:CR=1 FL=1
MAKGSGGVRANIYRDKKINDSKDIFDSYDEDKWTKSIFYRSSGGFLVTDKARETAGRLNKQEREKFDKEQRMCKKFASFGFQIEHLGEIPGTGSADVRLVGHALTRSLVRINGQLADLKSTSSANNIVKYAKKAVRKQGADIVLFEFAARTTHIENTIRDLSARGVHGYYYYVGERKCQKF